jgi:hypothetical protein
LVAVPIIAQKLKYGIGLWVKAVDPVFFIARNNPNFSIFLRNAKRI